MPSVEDVRELALSLPETHETAAWGNVTYKVRDKTFVWERPLTKSDLAALGDAAPPEGPIAGLRVADLDAKDALLAEEPEACFTIEHFHAFPAVLCLLDRVDDGLLRELITDAWLCRAPKTLAKQYLAGRGTPGH